MRITDEEIGSSTKIFPSRVTLSYPNFAEIFNNPSGAESESVVDVNDSDLSNIAQKNNLVGYNNRDFEELVGSNIAPLLI